MNTGPEAKFNLSAWALKNQQMVSFFMLLVIGAAMLMVRRVVPEALPAAVQSQPLWLQAIEALLVADIGFYLAHRAFHAVPFQSSASGRVG